MPSFVVTRCARHDTRYGGRLTRVEKSAANRRYRRKVHRELRKRGEDGDFMPRHYTGWDVV